MISNSLEEDNMEELEDFEDVVCTINKHEFDQSELIRWRSLSHHQSVIKPFVSAQIFQKLAKYAETSETVGKMSSVKKIKQPQILAPICKLRDYQLDGISWIADNYHKRMNCILADEMGLGKTLQTISFISHLIFDLKVSGVHLVVVPLSVMFNWITEFRKWCPTIKVLRFHTNDVSEQTRLKKILREQSEYQVAVTTYDCLKTKGMSGAFRAMHWRTIVLDEGHKIKNRNSQVADACSKMKAIFKLILTGTPVQNNLTESWSLLNFLFPTIFTTSINFDTAFDLTSSKTKSMNIDRDTLNKAHYLMRIYVLRRLKIEVEQTLPPKIDTLIKVPMSKMQRFWVQRLLLKEKELLGIAESKENAANGLEVGDTDLSSSKNVNISKLNSLFAQLKKASNHPFLFPGVEKPELDGTPTEDIVLTSGKMVILDRLLKKLIAKGHRVTIFSQYTRMLDIISDYLTMRGYEHCTLDGRTNRVMREVKINSFNQANSTIPIFLLSTRAGGEGINLFTADTVILFDSDWNPQVDIQAMARVHRIGQKRVVHVYRLVTAGTIEERIVQRALKKLFLDSIVVRGSSENAIALDKKIADQQLEKSEKKRKTRNSSNDDSELNDTIDEDNEDSGLELSQMLSMLKFGWNAVFAVENDDKNSSLSKLNLTDEDLDLIIDRTRGLPNSSTAPNSIDDKVKRILDKQESTADDFDEHSSFRPSNMVEDEEIHRMSTKEIAEAWKAKEEKESIIFDRKRQRISRTFEMKVAGVGMVQVLRQNDYALDEGEPSVYSREQSKMLAAAEMRRKHQSDTGVMLNSSKQVAGRDYDNQDDCQHCHMGGELICCDNCPTSWHMDCLSLECQPKMKMSWSCPHHKCATCNRTASAAGLIFRCETCTDSYCEDHLPETKIIIGSSSRMERLGYRLPGTACYMYCSNLCQPDYLRNEITSDVIINSAEVEMKAATKEKKRGKKNSNSQPRSTIGSVNSFSSPAAVVDLTASPTQASMTSPSRSTRSNTITVANLPKQPKDEIIERKKTKLISRKTSLDNSQINSQTKTEWMETVLKQMKHTKLSDASERIVRQKILSEKSRFISLSEVPLFSYRWDMALAVHRNMVTLLVKMINKLVATGVPGENDMMDVDEVVGESYEDTDDEVLNFAGVPTSCSYELTAFIFLEISRAISRFHSGDMIGVMYLLGISDARLNDIDSTAAMYMKDKIKNPVFKKVISYNSRHEKDEFIASFLVCPSIFNLLLSESKPGKGITDYPSDLITIWNYLEALSQRYIFDSGSFTHASVYNFQTIKYCTLDYATGSALSMDELKESLEPAARMINIIRRLYPNDRINTIPEHILEKILITYHREKLIVIVDSYNSFKNISDLSNVINDDCIKSSRSLPTKQIQNLKEIIKTGTVNLPSHIVDCILLIHKHKENVRFKSFQEIPNFSYRWLLSSKKTQDALLQLIMNAKSIMILYYLKKEMNSSNQYYFINSTNENDIYDYYGVPTQCNLELIGEVISSTIHLIERTYSKLLKYELCNLLGLGRVVSNNKNKYTKVNIPSFSTFFDNTITYQGLRATTFALAAFITIPSAFLMLDKPIIGGSIHQFHTYWNYMESLVQRLISPDKKEYISLSSALKRLSSYILLLKPSIDQILCSDEIRNLTDEDYYQLLQINSFTERVYSYNHNSFLENNDNNFLWSKLLQQKVRENEIQLKDILLRLDTEMYYSNNYRIKSFIEITNFENRWNETSIQTKNLLKTLIRWVCMVLIDGVAVDPITIIKSTADLTDSNAASALDDDYVMNYIGIPSSTKEITSFMFLLIRKLLSNVPKSRKTELLSLLGINMLLTESQNDEKINELMKFEPIFRNFNENEYEMKGNDKSSLVDELLAAFIVCPSIYSILCVENHTKVELKTLWKYFESLGVRLVSKHYFTAVRDFERFNKWKLLRLSDPKEEIPSYKLLKKWVGPVKKTIKTLRKTCSFPIIHHHNNMLNKPFMYDEIAYLSKDEMKCALGGYLLMEGNDEEE
eukprot:gene13175-17653_t